MIFSRQSDCAGNSSVAPDYHPVLFAFGELQPCDARVVLVGASAQSLPVAVACHLRERAAVPCEDGQVGVEAIGAFSACVQFKGEGSHVNEL